MPPDPQFPLLRPPLLEVAHVAHRLSFTQEYVRELIRRGELPASQYGNRYRIEARDLEAFIEKRRVASRQRTGG